MHPTCCNCWWNTPEAIFKEQGLTVGILIRTLCWQKSDLDQIEEIEQASFNSFDAYQLEDFDRWYHYAPDLFLVAEIDGRIAAYVTTRILP